MTNNLEAQEAISRLNGVTLWGKPIRVEESRPKLVAQSASLRSNNNLKDRPA
jgi:RNA recognition motif-containing protein